MDQSLASPALVLSKLQSQRLHLASYPSPTPGCRINKQHHLTEPIPSSRTATSQP
ncbi:uncharacterized protein BDW70DRAFT_68702 [Aspergillus foveolatus]|uniref:uncharacterized protein n=1 Tax=Aspergillus foveolatus TaxID=210207 RepID=UPI003CCD4E5E